MQVLPTMGLRPNFVQVFILHDFKGDYVLDTDTEF